ncbi:transcription elongation factor GreA [Thioalkalivibrio sp. XN8]|uniref:transcription elongation factor GreA n=1 Tax=Thioalkalivibrio sp. XN8 TaxID=2712863 RepID=UPI0013EDF112|nr:transcription elongation factor GreA [Thioalkalivibrio sp. XN8]NGP54549.1 transcription elongation factor GreA [Thioalkalivibrio sp. XN8]
MTKVPMTAGGAARLREELTRLKNVERPRISAAIGEARAHGDLRENAEYHAAKEQQGMVEARIRDLEYKLSHADIIDPAGINAGGRVVFGATVELFSEAEDAELRYQIVGEEEADIRAGRISIASPIARALIGKSEGDEVQVQAPGGDRVYAILKVEYI